MKPITASTYQPIDPVAPPKLSPIEKIWRIVKNFFERIGQALGLIPRRPKATLLVPPRSEALAHHAPSIHAERVSPLELSPSSAARVEPLSVKRYDPSLEKLRSFVQGFVKDAVQYTLKTEINPKIDSAQEGSESFINGLAWLGNKAMEWKVDYKPLNILMRDYTSAESLKTLRTHIKFLTDGYGEEEYAKLQEELSPALTAHSKVAIEWLKDPKVSFYQYVYDQDSSADKPHLNAWIESKKVLLEKFGKELGIALVKHKIASLQSVYDAKIKEKLPEVVQKSLENNSAMIQEQLTVRLCEIVQKVPFQKLVDALIGDLNVHAQAYIKAENCARAQIQEAKHTVKTSTDDAEIAKAENFLSQGEENILNKVITEQFVQQEISLGKKKADILAKLSNNVFNLLLPNDEFDALIEKIELPTEFNDFIAEIDTAIKTIASPDSQATIEMIKATLKSSFAPHIRHIIANNILKPILIERLSGLLDKGLQILYKPAEFNELLSDTLLPTINEKLLGVLFKKVLNAHLKELSPMFLKGDVAALSDWYLKCKTYAKLYHLDMAKFQQIATPILQELRDVIKGPLSESGIESVLREHLNKEEAGETNPLFGELVKNVVFDIGDFDKAGEIRKTGGIYGYLANKGGEIAKSQIDTFKGPLSEIIASALQPYRKSHEETISVMTDALLKKYGGADKVEKLLKDNPSPYAELEAKLKALQGLEVLDVKEIKSIPGPLSKPIQDFIDKPEAAKIQPLLDLIKEQVDKEAKAEQAAKLKKRAAEIKETAQITHDLIDVIFANFKQSWKTTLIKKGTGFYLGDDEKLLDVVITRIVEKLFDNEARSQNLCFKITDTFMKQMGQTAAALDQVEAS